MNDTDPMETLRASGILTAEELQAAAERVQKDPSTTWEGVLDSLPTIDEDRREEIERILSRSLPPDPGVVVREHEGRYSDPQELGKGGMGRVLAVDDRSLGRRVAVKELSGVSSASQERFLREARITAQLEHPGIVPVYELGQRADGSLYYTMKRVRGDSLTTALERCDTLDERLELVREFLEVCNAVAYAHDKGVIHRDLKPDNVMLGRFGETLVLDWGLARALGEAESLSPDDPARTIGVVSGSSNLTQHGSVMGTPRYMSPEQAWGRGSQVDARSDVWSLGAILYDILTGSRAFDALSSIEILQQVREGDFEPVLARCPEAPPDLASVVDRCLNLDKHERYPDAAALAEDIDAWLSGRRVSTHSYSSQLLMRRYVKHNRPLVTLAFVAGLAILVLGAFSYRSLVGERDRAVRAEQDARSALVQARARALVAGARERETLGDTGGAVALLRAAASLKEGEDATALAADVQRLVETAPVPTVLQSHSVPVTWIDATPGGGLLATAGADGEVVLWDTAAGASHSYELAGRRVARVALSDDGRFAAALSRAPAEGAQLDVWDLRANRHLGTKEIAGARARTFDLSPDGSLVVVEGVDGGGATQLFTLPTSGFGRAEPEALPLGARPSELAEVLFSPDSRYLVAADLAGALSVFDLRDRSLLAEEQLGEGLWRVALAGDGHSLVAVGREGTAWRLGFPLLEPWAAWPTEGALSGVAITSGGAIAAIQGTDGTVVVKHLGDGEVMHRWTDADRGVRSQLGFAEDDALVWYLGHDQSVVLRDLETGHLRARLSGGSPQATALAVTDGPMVVNLGSADGAVRRWVVASARLPLAVQVSDGPVQVLLASPTEDRVVAGDARGVLSSRSSLGLQPREPFLAASPDAGLACRAAFSDSGRLFAALWSDSCALGGRRGREGEADRLSFVRWSLDLAQAGEAVVVEGLGRPSLMAVAADLDGFAVLRRQPDCVQRYGADGVLRWERCIDFKAQSLAFSASGVVVAGRDALHTYRADGSERVFRRPEGVSGVASFGGGPLVVLGNDATLRWLDPASGDVVAQHPTPPDALPSLQFAPDGSRLALGSESGEIRTWAADGTPGATLRGAAGDTRILALSPSADRLAAVVAGELVVVWDLSTGDVVARHALGGEALQQLSFNYDGTALLGASEDGYLWSWPTSSFDGIATLAAVGLESNLRACPSGDVVAVTPLPDPRSIWAPERDCPEP